MASILTTSFYGAKPRAQHERWQMPQDEIDLNRRDVESEVDEDELEVSGEEESDYSSETESEDEANSGEENTE